LGQSVVFTKHGVDTIR